MLVARIYTSKCLATAVLEGKHDPKHTSGMTQICDVLGGFKGGVTWLIAAVFSLNEQIILQSTLKKNFVK